VIEIAASLVPAEQIAVALFAAQIPPQTTLAPTARSKRRVEYVVMVRAR
jgi:hypothetical protein